MRPLMLRKLYNWTLQAARRPGAVYLLAVISFAESSFFPIPPDVLLIPMALAKRAKAWFFAAVTTVASVLGGIFGYIIGYFLFDLIGSPLLDFYGYNDAFQNFAARYNEYGAWIVFTAGLTPIPFKVVTIASGTTGLNIWVFVVASLLARGLRFYAVAGALYWFGAPIRSFLERYLGVITIIFVILLLGGFALIKYAFAVS
jgi:membrane protein YqaA with SNARE-associated domain